MTRPIPKIWRRFYDTHGWVPTDFESAMYRWCKGPMGSPPLFWRRRACWMQNMTEEKLLHDLTRLLVTGTGDARNPRPCFLPKETQHLKAVFESHCIFKCGIKYWDQDTLVDYLRRQLPAASRPYLEVCSDVLHRSVLHFATYPFSITHDQVAVDHLTIDPLTRAIAFLSGRDWDIFHTNGSRSDSVTGSHVLGRGRTEKRSHEAFFRSLACSLDAPDRETSTAPEYFEEDREEVLDVLVECQPLRSRQTRKLDIEDLRKVAKKLPTGYPPLPSVSRKDILSLIILFVSMLDEIASDIHKTINENRFGWLGIRKKERLYREKVLHELPVFNELARKLERLATKISESTAEKIAFQELDTADGKAFENLQDSFAVLFNVFVQPKGIHYATRLRRVYSSAKTFVFIHDLRR